MFRITNSILMDRTYPKASADTKIEGVIWVKEMLWAVKVRAKMIWKKPSSFALGRLIVRNFVVLFSKFQASVHRYV